MISYNLTQKQILDFALKIYEESTNGYLDLKESKCNKMVDDFLADKIKDDKASKEFSNYSATTTSIYSNFFKSKKI